MIDSDNDYRLIAFLPWLSLKQPITLAGVGFVPCAGSIIDAASDLQGIQPALSTIISSYVTIKGAPRDRCALVTIPGRSPVWGLQPKDHETVAFAVLLLSLCAIAKNCYFCQWGAYANSTAFQTYWQRFQGSPEHIAVESRRRDGGRLDIGYKHGSVKFTEPLQTKTLDVEPDLLLAEGATKALLANSDSLGRVRSALSFFNLANTDSWTILPQAELIMAVASFEHVLAEFGKDDVAKEIGRLFDRYGSIKVEEVLSSRPDIARSPEDKDWFVHKKWIWELYHLRNKYTHGERADKYKWGWSVAEHLVMSSFVFPLVVKLSLAGEGHYDITPEDEGRCRAIDKVLAITAWDRRMEDSNDTAWQKTLSDAINRAVIQRKMAECNWSSPKS